MTPTAGAGCVEVAAISGQAAATPEQWPHSRWPHTVPGDPHVLGARKALLSWAGSGCCHQLVPGTSSDVCSCLKQIGWLEYCSVLMPISVKRRNSGIKFY